MEKLNIDIGLKSYQFVEGGAPLTFNPKDQNIYSKFASAIKEIQKIEQKAQSQAREVSDDAQDKTATTLHILEDADRQMKRLLSDVFGGNNDFDAILCGVNLFAINESGKRVVEALIEALRPILEAGAREYVNAELALAKMNRAQRSAAGI